MKRTLTTTEAAWFVGVDSRSFARWARTHDLQPVRHVRVGRSTVTVWSTLDLLRTVRVRRAGA